MAVRRSAGSSGRVLKKAPARRTPASGGPPARSRRDPGNPGFSGYEYQIEVTVWVALDLMLAKAATDEIVIEPPSDEDLQAAVTDPTKASFDLAAQGARLDLILQAKTRSGSPWPATAIADILLGKRAKGENQGRKRSRPLEMLEESSQRRYVFVTNEASAEALRPHVGLNLFDFPEVDSLLPHTRAGRNAAAQASLASRVLLLTGKTLEVLEGRIGALLSQHGHVATSRHAAALRDLREAVRQRIGGDHGGRWKRSELEAVLVQHGGSLAPTRDMDRYIRPRSYDAIRDRLERAHAVVIAGPSGTGKSLTADIVELEFRRGPPPFDVIGEEGGPSHVRANLTRSDSVLFHLRDPWGGNRLTPGADRWSGELPKLLDSAGPGRKFLITSRSDVLQSAGHSLMRELQPYVVLIEVEDYGAERLAQIYDKLAADLNGTAKQSASRHRDQALKVLTRPYEVKRFLSALGREDGGKVRKVGEMLADSQIDAISSVIADQLLPFGVDGAEAAAIIWAMLSARGAVARDVFAKLSRRLRSADPNLRADVDGLIDFLVAGQNLRRDGVALAFYHPRVEDGLRMTLMRHPRDAEHALSTTVDVLSTWDKAGEDWGLETGLNVLRATARIAGLDLDLSPVATQRLDQRLDDVASSTERRADFEDALRDLALLGSKDHPPARLARILVEGGPDNEVFVIRDRWRVPSVSDDDLSALRDDARSLPIIERFVREILPFPLLERLATDLAGPFWDALDLIANPGGPQGNIDVIVAGALAGTAPDYERAIERFARSEADADAWMEDAKEESYRAEEHAVDADVADQITDEPGERYFNPRQGMKVVVDLRREREGMTWIAGHPHRQLLLQALGELIARSRQAPATAELRFLLANADDWVREQALSAAQHHWHDSLSDLLDELIRSGMDSASQRRGLVELAAKHGHGDPVPVLITAAVHVSFARRLELVFDVYATRLVDDPFGTSSASAKRARAERLAQTFAVDERQLAQALLGVLDGTNIKEQAGILSQPGRQLLTTTLAHASVDLLGPLTCLSAAAGLDTDAATARLLATEKASDGEVAVQAIVIAGGSASRGKLHSALSHRRYQVRRGALRALASGAMKEERAGLISAATDQSAEVRLAFAELMEACRWVEAVDALANLLADRRDFAIHAGIGSTWSKFSVARRAARGARLGCLRDLAARGSRCPAAGRRI